MAQRDFEQRGIGYGAAIFAMSVIALTCYLTFAALQGEYGLFRLFQVEGQHRILAEELDALAAERDRLANLNRRLSSDSLDLDLLEEQARKVLGMARADEIVIR